MFLVCPARPGLVKRTAFEVLGFDRAAHAIELRYPDGRTLADASFHIDMAKRVGYSLTAEVPPEFHHA